MKHKNHTILPRHVAIIMDGNGTWARKRGLPRNFGHRQGAKALKNIVLYSESIGIKYLSVFAFSTENWSRPKEEVDFLMKMPIEFLENEKAIFKKNIKFVCIGERNRLSGDLRKSIEKHEQETVGKDGLTFIVALNYGGKDDIIQAVNQVLQHGFTNVSGNEFEKYLYTKDIPDVDLLIRTSGKQRLSNFLLWKLSYSELYFTNVLWPDFTKRQYNKALRSYAGRERKFGGI